MTNLQNIQVCIQYKRSPSREAGFQWVKSYWEARFPNVDILYDDSPVCNTAKNWNTLARRNPDKYLIMADADVFLPDIQLKQAINLLDKNSAIFPHNRRCYTTKQEAKRLLRNDPTNIVPPTWVRRNRERFLPGSFYIVHASLYLLHPKNESFIGWGCEDLEQLTRLPFRIIPGPFYHLYHKKSIPVQDQRTILNKLLTPSNIRFLNE